MPRSRSIAIQSERVWRRSRLALTWPASWIAPPNSRSFSVSVVLPASGCEMIAKVRRRSTSRASGDAAGVVAAVASAVAESAWNCSFMRAACGRQRRPDQEAAKARSAEIRDTGPTFPSAPCGLGGAHRGEEFLHFGAQALALIGQGVRRGQDVSRRGAGPGGAVAYGGDVVRHLGGARRGLLDIPGGPVG